MPKAQLIFIAGDLHGDWDRFNHFIDAEIRQPSRIRQLARDFAPLEIIILQTEDFGYWPHKYDAFRRFLRALLRRSDIKNTMPGILDGRIKIYWCDGNHENHDALDTLEAKQSPVQARPGGNRKNGSWRLCRACTSLPSALCCGSLTAPRSSFAGEPTVLIKPGAYPEKSGGPRKPLMRTTWQGFPRPIP